MRRRGQRKGKREPRPRGLGGFFLRGLIALLPAVLTLVVFGLAFQMGDRYVTGPINRTIYWCLEHNPLGWKALDRLGIDPLDVEFLDESLLPSDLRELIKTRSLSDAFVLSEIERHREPHLGVLRDLEELAVDEDRLRADVAELVPPVYGIGLSILLIIWMGWLVGGFVGRKLVQRLDRTMHMIPVVRSVYPYSKQLVEFFFAEKRIDFDTVVAVPYPSPGLWSLAFVTSSGLRTLHEETGKELITVFIPSSPMPMTGYTIFLEEERTIPLSISVDEALRITMTGGVLIPPDELPASASDLETHTSLAAVREFGKQKEEPK